MILKSIRSSPILLLITAMVFSLMIIIPLFTMAVHPVVLNVPFYFTEAWYSAHPIILKLLAVIFLLLISFVLINITGELKLFSKNTLLILLLFLVFASISPAAFQFSPLHISALLVLLCIRSILNLQVQQKINNNLMWSGTLLMLSGLFYPTSFIFLLPTLISILIIRPFRLREILVFIIGFLLPLIYYAAILYLSNNFSQLPSISEWKFDIHSSYEFGLPTKFSFGFVFILSLFSIFFLVGHRSKIAVRSRNFYNIWLIYMLFLLFTYMLSFSNFQQLYIMLLPFLSLLVSNYLIHTNRSWYWEILLIILTILSFAVNIAY